MQEELGVDSFVVMLLMVYLVCESSINYVRGGSDRKEGGRLFGNMRGGKDARDGW